MLAVNDDERRKLLASLHWYDQLQCYDWDRLLVVICSAFHLVGAGAIAFAPHHQLITQGTRPVFEQVDMTLQALEIPLTSRAVWAALFFAAGIAALTLTLRVSTARQLVTWFLVIPIGFDWSATFVLSVLNGGGSAMGAVAYPTLLTVWSVAAVRTALGSR